MAFLTLINHLLNFAAPALGVAVLLVAIGHVFMRKTAKAQGWIAPITLVFVVGCAVLALGAWWQESDGRMPTFAALVAAAATAYWLVLRGWR